MKLHITYGKKAGSVAMLAVLLSSTSVWADQLVTQGLTLNGTPTGQVSADTDVDTDTEGGIENLVTVTGFYGTDKYTNDAFENVDVVTADPDLTVTKTADKTTGAQVGDQIIYTYVISNPGNVTLTDVSISDTHYTGENPTGTPLYPANCTLNETASATTGDTVFVDPRGDGTTTSDALETFGPLDVITCTATYTVTQADVDKLQNP